MDYALGPFAGAIVWADTAYKQYERTTNSPAYLGAGTTTNLPGDAKVYQYQSKRYNPNDPNWKLEFSNNPRANEKEISTQYGPKIDNDPAQGLSNTFKRSPEPGDYYRETTMEKINGTGRSYDLNGGLNNPGHLSIYGNDAPSAQYKFSEIWSDPIPFFEDFAP